MATHNLARTIIENGRYHRHTKAKVPPFRYDPNSEYSGDEDYKISLGKIYRYGWDYEFADRIKVLERYLIKQVGRSWNDIYSKLCQRYDRRNLRNWHMFTHIKQIIVKRGDENLYGGGYRRPELKQHILYEEYCKDALYINDNGILCIGEEYFSPSYSNKNYKKQYKKENATILYYPSKKQSKDMIQYYVYYKNHWYIGYMREETNLYNRTIRVVNYKSGSLLPYNSTEDIYISTYYIQITPSSILNEEEQHEHNLYHGKPMTYGAFDKEITYEIAEELKEMEVRYKK